MTDIEKSSDNYFISMSSEIVTLSENRVIENRGELAIPVPIMESSSINTDNEIRK